MVPRLINPQAHVEKIAGEFRFTEGPVWIAGRHELLFSDIPADKIMRWVNGNVDVFRDPSGQSNGLTLDKQGRLIACEHARRRITRTESNDKITVLADRFENKRFNSPNDVVVKQDGAIYFTDPPYGVTPELRELDFQGVYRIAPEGKTLDLLAKDFIKPNGLAFSPEEDILYIADTEAGHIRAFDAAADGMIQESRLFALVDRPDGMKFDVEGHLYCTGSDGVWVFDPDGKHLGTIETPVRPANCAFGGADWKTLFMTCGNSLYRIRVNIPGVKVP